MWRIICIVWGQRHKDTDTLSSTYISLFSFQVLAGMVLIIFSAGPELKRRLRLLLLRVESSSFISVSVCYCGFSWLGNFIFISNLSHVLVNSDFSSFHPLPAVQLCKPYCKHIFQHGWEVALTFGALLLISGFPLFFVWNIFSLKIEMMINSFLWVPRSEVQWTFSSNFKWELNHNFPTFLMNSVIQSSSHEIFNLILYWDYAKKRSLNFVDSTCN